MPKSQHERMREHIRKQQKKMEEAFWKATPRPPSQPLDTGKPLPKKKPVNPLTAPAYETPMEEADAMDKGLIPKVDKELPELLDMETEEENTANPRPRTSTDKPLNEEENK